MNERIHTHRSIIRGDGNMKYSNIINQNEEDEIESQRMYLHTSPSPSRTTIPKSPNSFYPLCLFLWDLIGRLNIYLRSMFMRCVIYLDRYAIRLNCRGIQGRNNMMLILFFLGLFTIVRIIGGNIHWTILRLGKGDRPTEYTLRSIFFVERFEGNGNIQKEQLIQERQNLVDFRLNTRSNVPCNNTKQGLLYITDSKGYTCRREYMNKNGCCDHRHQLYHGQYTCKSCKLQENKCCSSYEFCVSCCMKPIHIPIHREYLENMNPSHPIFIRTSPMSYFQFCQFHCRSSSSSTFHQNSYRSIQTYCFGLHRPKLELNTMNSDRTSIKYKFRSSDSTIIMAKETQEPIKNQTYEMDLLISNTNT